jgi:uncharacterized protein (TIGR02594 family)
MPPVIDPIGALPELPWVEEMRRLIGQREIPGGKHNPFIVGLWSAIGVTWFSDDETPWCAGVLAWCLKRAKKPILGPATVGRALAWLTYGGSLDGPAYGAVAVKSRAGGGHVGFVVGRYRSGHIAILGGNQDDQVKISAYNESVFTFRWPGDKNAKPAPGRFKLPLLENDGRPVLTEA